MTVVNIKSFEYFKSFEKVTCEYRSLLSDEETGQDRTAEKLKWKDIQFGEIFFFKKQEALCKTILLGIWKSH